MSSDNNGASPGDDAADAAIADHQHQTPRVLGVAFIVDHSSGPRLLARYPTRPPNAAINESNNNISQSSKTTSNSTATSTTGLDDSLRGRVPTRVIDVDEDDDDDHRYGAQKDELFFTLTPRQMAKLFRTKKALCGQPMTLRVNRTVFCCHAMLLDTGEHNDDDSSAGGTKDTTDDKSDNASTSNNTATKEDKLCLFSVVVALSAPDRHGAVPFSSFWDASNDDHYDLQRFLREISAATHSHKGRIAKKTTAARVSATFLAIRRVHISISRYVRALTREESRCQYVTLQAELFFDIRNNYQSSSIPTSSMAGVASSSTSAISQVNTQDCPNRPSHKRQVSSTPSLEDGRNRFLNVSQGALSVEEEQDKEQEILELMLSAPPPRLTAEQSTGISALRFKHQGNLVRELVDLFHSLSRNDTAAIPNYTSLMSGKETVIYVNKHIAIPIEPVGIDTVGVDKTRPSVDATVQPFQTLLFPHASSPSEVLGTFQIAGSATPHKLEQLLLTVSSRKSLAETAMSSNLPLHTTIEIASLLITQGICISSPVIRSTSRFTTVNIRKIQDLALEFSESFPSINIFQAVSFLTTPRTLGETVAVVVNIDNPDGAWLRDAVSDQGDEDAALQHTIEKVLSPSEPPPEDTRRWVEHLEDVVFSLTKWLMSHQVIETLQDYVVRVDEIPPENPQQQQQQHRPSTPSSASPSRRATPTQDADDNLFREITKLYSLNGKLSTTALSWQLGMDVVKLRSWAMRHPRIRLLWRVPSANDDAIALS